LLVDVGVPTDIKGATAERDDVLILTGGLVRLPDAMASALKLLWFQHGMIPSCLGETMLLGLENREESLSLGRELQPETVQEIGGIARQHGFEFSRLISFGCPLKDEAIVKFQKSRVRLKSKSSAESNGKPRTAPTPAPKRRAERAARLYARYLNP